MIGHKLKRGLKFFVAFLLSAILMLIFVGCTQPGLKLGLFAVKLFSPGKLSIKHAKGVLVSGIELAQIDYQDGSNRLRIDRLKTRWSLGKLLEKKIHIKQILVDGVDFKLSDSDKTSTDYSNNKTSPPTKLPLNISIDEIRLRRIKINEFLIDKLQATANINTSELNISDLIVQLYQHTISSDIRVNIQDDYPVQANVNIHAPQGINGHLSLLGTTNEYRMSFKTAQKTVRLDARLIKLNQIKFIGIWEHIHGHIKQSLIDSHHGKIEAFGDLTRGLFKLQAQINHLTLNETSLAQLNLTSTINTKTNTSSANFNANYSNHPLTIKLGKIKENLTASLHLASNSLSIQGRLPFRWQIKAKLNRFDVIHPKLNRLRTQMTLDAATDNAHSGTFTLQLNPGTFQISAGSPETLRFQGGHLSGILDSKGFDAQGTLSLDTAKSISLHAFLPQLKLNRFSPSTQKFTAKIHAIFDDLSYLDDLIQPLSKTKGQLTGIIKAQGTLDKPKLSGLAELKHAETTLTDLGITIKPITLKTSLVQNDWQLTAQAGFDQTNLSIKGSGTLSPSPNANLNLSGRKLKVIDTHSYQAYLSPRINIAYKLNRLQISGSIDIDKASIKPKDFSSSVSLSDDAVFVNTEQDNNSSSLTINSNILLSLGKNVSLNYMGLTGKIRGQLNVHEADKQTTTATGTLRIAEGKYEAYGQKLHLEQADIIFGGGAIDNPGLHIKAVKQFNNTSTNQASQGYFNFDNSNLSSLDFSNTTTVGIEIRGRAQSPKISLFSIPSSLSQADILSLLVLGRPANQASKADGQLLLSAISSLNLGQGNQGMQLLQQIQNNTGIDISIDNQAQYNQESNSVLNTTALVLGKALSPRLYISYSLGLSQSSAGVFTIKYLLNRYFNVQIETSDTANGADIFYTYPNR